jgi:hypothetical protein
MKRWLIILLLCIGAVQLQAQVDSTDIELEDDEPGEWLKGNMNETHKFGIRFGLSTSTMFGSELENPRPFFGLNGAGYYRYRYSEKSALQLEVGFSLRGSKFSNAADEYSSLRMYCIDAPLYWVRSINKSNNSHLLIGAQYSYILNPNIYIGRSALPDDVTPKLNPNDVMAVAGTQFYAGFVGFQLLAKYGLIDINNGLIENLKPTYKGGNINNFTFEINFLF